MDAAEVRASQPVTPTLAPPEVRHAVYSRLWHELGEDRLSDLHRRQLDARGLPPGLVQRAGLATWPDLHARREITTKLTRQFSSEILITVPGWWSSGGRLVLGGPPGLAIPVYDLHRRLVAVQLRPDDPTGGKYVWLSSAGRDRQGQPKGGPSPGAPVYLARRHPCPGPIHAPAVLLTEGALKALRAVLDRTEPLAISLPGVSYWRACLPILEAVGARRVVMAWDSDWRHKPEVARSLMDCHARLTARRLEVTLCVL